MGCCSSQPSQTPAGRAAFPAPLPPPMQDNMNELLNRWRHGEVNLLQRRFRLARAQAVKHTIASKILGLAAPPSNSGTATSAATSTNREASFAEEGSSKSSPASRNGAATATATATATTAVENKKALEGPMPMPGQPRGPGGAAETEDAVSLGDAGGARAGMDKDAFLRVFPRVQDLPLDVQRSSYRLFDCVGRGSLDFRNFCRALALCCRGSREERLRFLFDLFSAPTQPKHYGTGADGGARDAIAASGGNGACLSESELTGLKKQLALAEVDAIHTNFQAAAGSGLLLDQYFEWAETHVSDEALDRALGPFYLLPSPQQEKDKVLTHLMGHTMEEGQWMCLVATPWWSYWSSYAGLTKEDLERVPERWTLGFGKTQAVSSAGAGRPSLGAQRRGDSTTPVVAMAGPEDTAIDNGNKSGGGSGKRNGKAQGGAHTVEPEKGTAGGTGKERAVPTMLARRPHEIDNSTLQGGAEWEVAPNLELGDDYVMLPKSLWDVMVEWYGGGPVFCRQVVKVATPSLELPKRARTAYDDEEPASSPGSLVVDLYPLALHVSLCDSSGRPGQRERLVLSSHHVRVRDMLSNALDSSRLHSLRPNLAGLDGSDTPSAEEDAVLELGDASSCPEDDRCSKTTHTSDTAGDVRLWVLEISPTGLTDTPRSNTSATSASACRPRFSFVGGRMMMGGDLPTGVSRWKLVKAEEECLSLSALGLIGGEKVILETKAPDGTWPRRNFIEPPNFRQFRENDRVDAMDYQGRWFRGQVVEVGLKSSSKIVDSEGPVGKKKNNRRPRRQSSSEEPGRGGTIDRGDSSEGHAGRAATNTGLGMADHSPEPSLDSSQELNERRVNGAGGDVGGSTREGGPSRRRMRVRVHFDRFAPQWDEWYDSKSLKLAPEMSHTAPLVPAQPVLKPREEGATDTEGDEEVSPNAQPLKYGVPPSSGVSSTSSKTAGSAFPPPVGRFPGDAANGNNWNSRAHNSSRSNGTGGSSTADGISNYGGGALNRRSNTPGKPPIAGACGLVNVGNTCYLNSAVQCLSHTPLVRAYLLSDMWASEVNKYNPLGTQGKLVEDFASLLKSLWSQEYLCIFPSKFKRGLIKYKPQFAGNEQQDSQEFLAEMLDALHEDVNRVIDKPYVPAPEGDEAESGRSDQDLADDAWDRHVQRNRSVIVDLFQGQLKMECRCPVCNKKSVTFDPFMYLSVPIPVRLEKMVMVVMLPRIRRRDIAASNRTDGEAAEFSNPRQLVPVRYGMMLPRLGELSDLKRALSNLCGVPSSSLVVSVMQQSQLKIMGDKDPLTDVREEDSVLAFAMGESMPNRRARPVAATPSRAATSPAESPAARPASARGPRLEDASARAGAGAGTASKLANGGTPQPKAATGSPANGAGAAVGKSKRDGAQGGEAALGKEQRNPAGTAVGTIGENGGETLSEGSEEDEDTDLDDDRPPLSTVDRRSPDERCEGSLPVRFRDLEVGWRLDALDDQGSWYAATVVEVEPQANMGDGGKSLKAAVVGGKGDGYKRETGLIVKVHFDGFTSKWDETYGEHDWRNKLAPLYSKARPQKRATDISVVHRKTIRIATAGHAQAGFAKPNGSSSRDGSNYGRVEGGPDGRDAKEPPGFITAKELFGLPFVVRCPPGRSLRYLWRLVVQQASRFVAGSSGSRSFKTGSKDKMAKAAAGASERPHVTAAWVARAAVGLESGITDEKLAELLPFTIKFVLRQNPLTEVSSVEVLPDRWRAASSLMCTKLILALDWKDAPRDYLDVLTAMFDHPSYLELESNAQSAHSGLTLEQCLDAYTREETLEEEDSWYCSNCRTHRRGIMKIDLWKMPDVLVIHMKRFQCSARWREKIRTLVFFPHSGLDMSGFVSSNSAHRNQAGGGQAGMVYDLYGVVNHMGGMTGGHYTACCRSSPCSKDGVEEVTGWGLEHPWLNFDDEFVEEMAPDKIVSEAAYVLFYRRRRLTPSNVINMTI